MLVVEGEQTHCFPWRGGGGGGGGQPVCYTSKLNAKRDLRKNNLLDGGWQNKFAAVSRCTTGSRTSRTL